ncbi:MAG: hypothetical protein ACRERE_22130 [Candidatus Entotheonellia bacterium]
MRCHGNPVHVVHWRGLCTTVRRRLFILFAAPLLLCNVLSVQAGEAPPKIPEAWDTPVGVCPDDTTPVGGISRRPITSNIVEYSWQVRVGAGARDIIGMHRVVKELAPFVPHPTAKAVLMAHGDIWGFDAAFLASLASASIPDNQALPVFLAQNNVDVWGIDFRWTLVPQETTDFGFMEGWDIGTDLQDLDCALSIARLTRDVTGSGSGEIHLLGWSRGGMTGYAYLSAETQNPNRHVRGFIPVDIFVKTNREDLRQAACDRLDAQQARLDAGTFHDATGLLLSMIGTLARHSAQRPLPLWQPNPPLAGLTNLQAALFLGTSTFTLFQPAPPVPFYHFTGGPADDPLTLLYTQEEDWIDFLQGTAPYEPVNIFAQGEGLLCHDDLPFDDHLGGITVPVLYVGAGGGFGEFGVYTTTLLGSTDVTIHLVDQRPEEQRVEDFGHADLFLADKAKNLAWKQILNWIKSH